MSAFGGKADIGHGSPCHPVRAGFAMTTLRKRVQLALAGLVQTPSAA
jgi:hypothetical protein